MLTALFILNDIFHLWAVNTCSDVHKGTFPFNNNIIIKVGYLEIKSSHHSLTTAMQHQKKKVRFIGYPLIKTHASVLVSRRAN